MLDAEDEFPKVSRIGVYTIQLEEFCQEKQNEKQI